jgi:heme exporter protein A
VKTSAIRLLIDGVSKRYGARRVLDNIEANLSSGDVLLVTGHNGVGKSTLLRVLAGLQRPSTGIVTYVSSGVEIEPTAARSIIGMVGPDVHLYRELTAREHIEFIADVRSIELDVGAQQAMLTNVGLGGRGDELVGGFSSGMQQRLRYALALLHQPTVLLLDEPTTNLDQAGIAIVDRIIAEQRMRGLTVIATNDPRDRKYGDFVLALGEA